MAMTYVGACFCGAVGIEATGEPIEMGYCHCASCRAYSGGPFGGYMLWRAQDVRITRGLTVALTVPISGMLIWKSLRNSSR